MYFDVKNGTIGELKQIELEGDEWAEFTGHCRRGCEDNAYEGERRALQLVRQVGVHRARGENQWSDV
jgi:hypothetical protein